MTTLKEFINFESNDELSKLSKKELIYFFNLLDNYYLEYRKSLNTPSKYTFGIEIEAEYVDGAFNKEIEPFYSKGWLQNYECSLTDGDEYVSPILCDNIDTWIHLKKICNILNKHYQIKDTCGGHIHIGTHILGKNNQTIRNFIKLWATYENVIYRFSYGEFLNPRCNTYLFFEPVAKKLFEVINDKDFYSKHFFEVINICNLHKSYGICFSNIKNRQKEKDNTIEIRCPNGTLEPIIWQNNINFFMKLMLYSKSCNYDNDIVEKRKNIIEKENVSYNQIYVDQALELADMIFNNNLDKVYFLRQYLKSFQEVKKEQDLKPAKTFIKK